MGVDSGLPDFRGGEGFWNAYPALGKLKIDFQSSVWATIVVRDQQNRLSRK